MYCQDRLIIKIFLLIAILAMTPSVYSKSQFELNSKNYHEHWFSHKQNQKRKLEERKAFLQTSKAKKKSRLLKLYLKERKPNTSRTKATLYLKEFLSKSPKTRNHQAKKIFLKKQNWIQKIKTKYKLPSIGEQILDTKSH